MNPAANQPLGKWRPKRCLCRHALLTHGREEAGGWSPVCRKCECTGYETGEIRQEREQLGDPSKWAVASKLIKNIRINRGYVGQ